MIELVYYVRFEGIFVFSYSFTEWIAFFYIYCFIGWIIESTIVSLTEKKLVNRGFLRVPMLPLYGFGALVILFATDLVRDNPTLVFICGALSCTLLEYVTGIIMESLFKIKYWDYTGMSFNIKGKICLTTTLFWGFLSLFFNYQLHYLVVKIVSHISTSALIPVVAVITLIFSADVAYSIKTAFDVKKVLAKLTTIKSEIEKLVSQTIEQSDTAQSFKEKISSLNTERQKLFSKITFYPRSLIKSNPDATSSAFNEALKELKSVVSNHKDEKSDE